MAETHLHALPAGYEIEGYRIERVLGAGGFGITYKAQETLINRAVAVKEYMPNSVAGRSTAGQEVRPLNADDSELYRWGLKRFRNEARTLVAFHHPNIVAVYRYFEGNGTAYLVMAFEDGMTLAAVLKKAGTLEESEIHEFLDPLLNGVEQVHRAGFLHRDIKPANIVLRRDGTPVLIDFGAARLALGTKSQGSRAVLSPGYAPFEQYATVAEQGPFTDIYALGATLYACISGQRPVEAPDRVAGVAMKPAAEIGHGRYTPSFLAAIDHALAVKAEDRPRDIAQWRKELSGESPPVGVAYGPAPVLAQDGTMMLAAAQSAAPRRAVDSDSTPTAPPPAFRAATRTQSAPPRHGRTIRAAVIAAAVLLLAAGAYAGIDYYRAAERERTAAAIEKARLEEKQRQEELQKQREKAERDRADAQKRERAEAAAAKAREAQQQAQTDSKKAEEARQQAQSSADCGRRAAARARSGSQGHGSGPLGNGQYAGQVSNNAVNGCGVFTEATAKWEGTFRNGNADGYGVLTSTQGWSYEGVWRDTKVVGHGALKRADGSQVLGIYDGWSVSARATIIDPQGNRYDGDVNAFMATGYGALRMASGELFEGEFKSNRRHGLGVATAPDGKKTFGRWENGDHKGLD